MGPLIRVGLREFASSLEPWAAFRAAIDRDPRYLPRLAAVLDEPSVLDEY